MTSTSNMRTAKVTDMVMVMMAAVRHGQHQQHENGERDRYGDGDDGSGATWSAPTT